MSSVSYRRRGTAIIENTHGGILIAASARKDASKKDQRPFILPGGGAERGETRFIAALRELKEETGLQPYAAEIIFMHKGKVRPTMSGRRMFQDHHTVCVVKASGRPKPNMHDVKQIDWYYPGSHIWISKTTREIIDRYYQWKQRSQSWEPSQDQDENDSDVVDTDTDIPIDTYDSEDETAPDT